MAVKGLEVGWAPTREFLDTHPTLVAKLLCLDGLRGLTSGSQGSSLEGLTPTQREQRSDTRALQRYMQSVEATLVEQLHGSDLGEQLSYRALMWRQGFPPHASDFSAEERDLVQAHTPTVPFLAIAAEFIPVEVGIMSASASGS